MFARTALALAGAAGLTLGAASAEAVTLPNFGGSVTCTCTLLPPATAAGAEVNPTVNDTDDIGTFRVPDPDTTNPFGGSSAEAETWYLEQLVGVDLPTGVQINDPGGGGKTGSFAIPNVPYFILKYDGFWAFFQNDDGAQTISWDLPFGLSHITLVPLPGALGLFLTAIAGLFGWRKWSERQAGAPVAA